MKVAIFYLYVCFFVYIRLSAEDDNVVRGKKTDIEMKVAIFYLYVCFFVIYQEIL